MGWITAQALYPQLLIGLINGAAYALLSLGLSIIFGLLNVINFAHGALYMLGAFVTWGLLHYAGIPYCARCSTACTGSIRCTTCCSRSASP
jgi:branched-chain amino acid transport system permease protein